MKNHPPERPIKSHLWFLVAALTLTPIISCSRVDLSNAYLSKADLSKTELSKADLSKADLTKAMLSPKRVVFIPLPIVSHIRGHMHVARELNRLGHRVWVCVPDVILMKENATEAQVGVRIISYGEKLEDLQETMMVQSKLLDNFWSGKGQDIFVMYKIGTATWQHSLNTLSDERFWSGIQAVRPDLVVLDWTPFCKTTLAVPYKLNVPFAFIGPYHDVVNAKVPHTSACNPQIISDLNDRMTFLERIQNTLIHVALMAFNPFCDDNILHRFVPEKAPIKMSLLSTQAEIFLAETDHVMDYARPTLPNTKLIGGTAARPSKILEEPFRAFADNATNGTAIVTFGTTILGIPEEISKKMTAAFMRLDMKVVWRSNLTTPAPSKILTASWIPQNDILGHSNTRVFVSHCGLNGQYEALYHGVPILCLPIFADQYYNARRVVNKGFGLRADIRQATSKQLAQLINELAYNSKYRSSIRKASRIFRQLYNQPRVEAAFWLDHVLRFGGSYMRYAGQDMPLYQYLLLDVIATIAGVILLSVLVVCVFVRRVFHTWGNKVKNE